MKKMIWRATAVIVLIILAAGFWYYITYLRHVAIEDILKDPRQYEGKSLTISGQVMERTSFLFVKYYKLRDNTGEITVVTKRLLPAVGANIRVKGTIDSAFSIGPDQILVLNETEARQNK